VYPDCWVPGLITELPYPGKETKPWERGDKGGYDRNVELVLGIVVIAVVVALLVWLID